MNKSRLICKKEFLTNKANKQELFHRDKVQDKEQINAWKKRIMNGRLNIISQLKDKHVLFYGNILELGAGMCWFSSELSKLKTTKEIYALEFSKEILTKVAPSIMEFLNAKQEKITRVVGDFYKIPLKNNYFDFVVFDAALHHVVYLDDLLKEIDRVLKKDGKMIAIREPVLPVLRKFQRGSWGKEDKAAGITELIFTKNEWKKMFNDKGYDIQFISYAPTNKILHKLILYWPFSLLNNLLFGNYVFVIRKKANCKYLYISIAPSFLCKKRVFYCY